MLRAQSEAPLPRPVARLLGHDTPLDFAFVVALFAVFLVTDRLVEAISDIDPLELNRRVLAAGALASNTLPAAALVVMAAAVAWRWPRRVACRWADLEQGRHLRVLAAPMLLLLAWQGSLYDVNYLLGRTHALDRMAVVALAIAALWRPMFLMPFALMMRIVNDQFDYPFGAGPAENIDELLILALLAIAAAHLLYVLTGRKATAPVVLLLSSIIGAHYFIPGKGKLSIDWLQENEIGNLAQNAYTAGWLRGGDGGWAEGLADLASGPGKFLVAGTLILELGALIAVTNHRILRWWLPGWITFHVVLFAFTGFWFLGWIALDVGLLIILTRPDLRGWLDQNATWARAGLAAFTVLAGGTLFHPPGLAWLDAPVAYGYEVSVVDEAGTRHEIPLAAFAPFEQELTFLRLSFTEHSLATGGYGAVSSVAELAPLEGIQSARDLLAYEDSLPSPAPNELSVQFMAEFMMYMNAKGRPWWSALSPPDRFWTSDPGDGFDFDEPIARLEVTLLRAVIVEDGTQDVSRTPVLELGLDAEGRPVIVDSIS